MQKTDFERRVKREVTKNKKFGFYIEVLAIAILSIFIVNDVIFKENLLSQIEYFIVSVISALLGSAFLVKAKYLSRKTGGKPYLCRKFQYQAEKWNITIIVFIIIITAFTGTGIFLFLLEDDQAKSDLTSGFLLFGVISAFSVILFLYEIIWHIRIKNYIKSIINNGKRNSGEIIGYIVELQNYHSPRYYTKEPAIIGVKYYLIIRFFQENKEHIIRSQAFDDCPNSVLMSSYCAIYIKNDCFIVSDFAIRKDLNDRHITVNKQYEIVESKSINEQKKFIQSRLSSDIDNL